MTTRRRVAIIGAGAAGLSAARHLLERGHHVVVFEIGSRIGGLWVHDNDNGLSVAYESLHINSEPSVTSFRGHPFPPGTSVVPSHREVATYFQTFAADVGITPHVRFNSRVSRVCPVGGRPGDGWVVEVEGQGEELFDDVVVGSGHQGVPAHPAFAEHFGGEYLHSHAYRTPEPFAGQRVLVIGVGNSGLDIAADLATVAAQTHVAARSPVLIMPRMIWGVPAARVMAKLNKPFFPWPVQRLIMRTISRMYHGTMEQWGLRTPTTRTHPASNATFMAHVAYRKILCHPGVKSVAGRVVTFADDSVIEVDTIIAATGYEVDLPFLDPAVDPVVDRRVELYKRVVHPDWPGLYFVGFFNVSGGANISMMDVQSEWVAAMVSGSSRPPSQGQMRRSIADEAARTERRFPGSPRYGLELEPRQYRREISAELHRAARVSTSEGLTGSTQDSRSVARP